MNKKLLSFIGVLTLTAMSLSAQNVATPTAGASNMDGTTSDYVTIGSRVPYFVQPDASIQAMTTAGTMKESIFQWLITDNTGTNVTGFNILKYDGSGTATQYDNFRTTSTTSGFYDNEMSVSWATPTYSAGTKYEVKVTEKSVTKSSTIEGCLSGTQSVRDVYVLAQPTVAFAGTEGGGCGTSAGSSFYVPLTITGLGSWQVTYTVAYNGGAESSPATYTLTAADPIASITDANVIAQSTSSRSTTSNDGLKIDLPASQYGYYDVKITNITDRISRKSLDVLAASSAAGSYRIYVNPAPVTSPIQHVKNL